MMVALKTIGFLALWLAPVALGVAGLTPGGIWRGFFILWPVVLVLGFMFAGGAFLIVVSVAGMFGSARCEAIANEMCEGMEPWK